MNNIPRLLNVQVTLYQTCRLASRNAYNWKDEGIKYEGFKYYPRDENVKDPEYKPSKLFRVQRIVPLKGVPHFEKQILRELKLDGKQSDITIVKNTPDSNGKLWKIKHLIKISPITFPNGFPKDITGTVLKENGELIVTPRLVPDEKKFLACESFIKDTRKLNGDTLRRELRKKWLSGW